MRKLLTSLLITVCFQSQVAIATSAEVPDAPAAMATAVETTTAPTVETTTAPAAVSTEVKAESEIPLNLDVPKKSSEEGHPFFKFLLAISLMGVIGAGAFFFIRKYSKNNFAINRHNQIKILTQHYLGPKKSLAIIRVAGESILIGVTEHNISMIKSLSLLDDEVPDSMPEKFSGLLEQEQEQEQDHEEISSSRAEFRIESEDDEFSIRGVKEIVSKRLKGMRSLR